MPSLRERLETEATELNSIGNSHLIRHSEISQVPVIDVDQVDYLFHRLPNTRTPWIVGTDSIRADDQVTLVTLKG